MAPSIRSLTYGEIRFSIYASEPHGLPHAHVWIGGQVAAVINLFTGGFIYEPPAGKRRNIRKAFLEVQEDLIALWEALHGEG